MICLRLYKNIRKDSKKRDKTFRLRYNLPEYPRVFWIF